MLACMATRHAARKRTLWSGSARVRTSDLPAQISNGQAKNYNWPAVRVFVESYPELLNMQPAGRWSALHQFSQARDLEFSSCID